MGLTPLSPIQINPSEYGRLCAEILPKVIESDAEFDRFVARMEVLDRKQDPTPEEQALAKLLEKLIEDYDAQNHPLPDVPPAEIVRHLMNAHSLKQADLVPIIGSRSQFI